MQQNGYSNFLLIDMKFHYDFAIKKLQPAITHHHSIMMIGSCFTENMGNLLRASKFKVMDNPNGILFNPISVTEAVQQYINNKSFSKEDLFCLNESWHSWKHHSKFSGITVEDTIEKINQSTFKANDFLKKADYLLITLGSAWVYEFTNEAEGATSLSVAANNHKAPASWFSKRLLSANETIVVLQKMLAALKIFNSHLTIIFTISPVRHLREGVIENNRSKAVLIQAVHDIVMQSEHHYYFPSYELMIDDLRDYRFYAEDLVHPNYQATQYIWEKFVEVCLSEDAQQLLKNIQEINIAYQHKPFNPSTIAHQKFLMKYTTIVNQLKEKHPELNLQNELNYFVTETK